MLSPVADRTVLVTGGVGSFGQAFVRRILALRVHRVVVLSRDEAKQAAMRQAFDDPRLRFFVGDVRSLPRLMDAMRGVDVVVHAAAMKRIEVCEADPNEAVETNIVGTQNVARAAIANGVSRAVVLSTDKAAAPNTLYGATKLVAERLWINSNVYAAGTPTRFAATRYGNVANSRGSVMPLFRAQAAAGRPLTLTDPRMTRFWMGMDAAVDLVLLALRHMRGGEVFVPSLGAAPMHEVANAIAPDAAIQLVGLRPGEKLHEVLVTENEAPHTYAATFDDGCCYIIEPEARTWDSLGPPDFPRVPDGFTYRSDTADPLSPAALRALINAA